MKYLFSSILLLALCLTALAQKRKGPKVEYEFPAEMAPAVREGFLKLCEKGRVLYALNCAKCHNTVVKGHEVIPDFSQEKLIGYELRVANGEHESSMPDEKVTAEELALINTFLMYKKKEGPSPILSPKGER